MGPPGDRKLLPRAAQLLDAPDEERISHIKKRTFIVHPRVKGILKAMEELLEHPRTDRMPNLLLVGRSNAGKTALLKHFHQLHPPTSDPDEDAIFAPVVLIQAPPMPDDDFLIKNLLKKLSIRPRVSAKPSDKIDQAAEALVKVRTKVLLIDELNSILAGSVTRQAVVLNTIKYLSNEVGISIVASGTQDAMQAIATDPQYESRFQKKLLPRWTSVNSEFRNLMASFERTLPLRNPSNLWEASADVVYASSDGTTGNIASIIRGAAVSAVTDGSESISREHILEAAKTLMPPSDEDLAQL